MFQPDEEFEAGKAAAERLCHSWPDISWLPAAASEAWAQGAIAKLADLMRQQPALFRASREGSDRGAEALSPRPFQGLVEALQNADDLGATELRFGIRYDGSCRDLLIVHDGAPVHLGHVGAMVLPWVTTKADDAHASGRFGIGQKTLLSLGGPVAVYCAPFAFRVESTGPVVCAPHEPVPNLYAPDLQETLLVVPLLPSVNSDDMVSFLDGLGSQALLFLRTIRRLAYIDILTGISPVDHRLVEGDRSHVPLRVSGHDLIGERLEVRDPRSSQGHIRYIVERPLTGNDRRHHKSVDDTTTLGVAISASSSEAGGFYDRLPLPISSAFTFSLNAQFDPDTARTTLLQRPWNENRFQDLGDLLGAVALDCFVRQAVSGWRAVPLAEEVPIEAGGWMADRIRRSVIVGAQRRVADELRLYARGQMHGLSKFVYEALPLNDLLTPDDQERLLPGCFAVVPESRDAEGRWRKVLDQLGRSEMIEPERALDLFDQEDSQLGPREPAWYVSVAQAAIGAGLLNSLLFKRSLLLADGSRIEAPGHGDPRSLVCHAEAESLAAMLGVALPIHPAYLADTDDANSVNSQALPI